MPITSLCHDRAHAPPNRIRPSPSRHSCSCLGLVAPPAGAATGDVTEFTIPTPASLPQGIVVGPDGVCVVRSSGARTRSGRSRTAPSASTRSRTPARLPSGSRWVPTGTCGSRSALGEPDRADHIDRARSPSTRSRPPAVSPEGSRPGPTGPCGSPNRPATGSDGSRTAGEITEFALPRSVIRSASGSRQGRTVRCGSPRWARRGTGSGGSRRPDRSRSTRWCSRTGNRRISRRGPTATSGSRNVPATPSVASRPVGRSDEFVLPSSLPNPVGIAAGPDGNVWFAEFGRNNIGRITPDGTITEFPLPNPSSQPFGIALGVDGAMWFTEAAGNRIGRIEVAGCAPPDLTAPTVTITTPADGAVFTVGQVVVGRLRLRGRGRRFGPRDLRRPGGQRGAIDTSLGTHTFTVSATDVAGNPGGAIATYLVTAPPGPHPADRHDHHTGGRSGLHGGQVVVGRLRLRGRGRRFGPRDLRRPGRRRGSDRHLARDPHVHRDTRPTSRGTAAERTATYAGARRPGRLAVARARWNDATAGSSLTVSFDLGALIGTDPHARGRLWTRRAPADTRIRGSFSRGLPDDPAGRLRRSATAPSVRRRRAERRRST